MNMDHVYNKRDPRSIEAYAQQLIGKTFNDVIEYAVENKIAQETRVKFYGNKARKGGLGNLLEELYFGYKANSDQEADFAEAGVELKATPYDAICLKNMLKGIDRNGKRFIYAYQ